MLFWKEILEKNNRGGIMGEVQIYVELLILMRKIGLQIFEIFRIWLMWL